LLALAELESADSLEGCKNLHLVELAATNNMLEMNKFSNDVSKTH